MVKDEADAEHILKRMQHVRVRIQGEEESGGDGPLRKVSLQPIMAYGPATWLSIRIRASRVANWDILCGEQLHRLHRG